MGAQPIDTGHRGRGAARDPRIPLRPLGVQDIAQQLLRANAQRGAIRFHFGDETIHAPFMGKLPQSGKGEIAQWKQIS